MSTAKNGSTEVLKFWRHLFGGQAGKLAVWSAQRADKTEMVKGTESTRYFDYPASAEAALAHALKESETGREAYFCVHLLTAGRRVKENAAPVISLWGESDGGGVPSNGLVPTALVESSPGRFHVYYRLTDAVPPEVAEGLNRRLACKIGADPSGFDLTQLLRVPHTVNHKYPERPVVRLLRLDAGRSYSPAELDVMLPEVPLDAEHRDRARQDEPPVQLDAGALQAWRGEEPKLRDGQLDRSGSLLKIGRVLYDAGANRAVIVEALEERDRALGWNKYAERRDAGVRYAEIADELEKSGRNERGRVTFGGRSSSANAGRDGDTGTDDAEDSSQKEDRRNQADRLIGYALEHLGDGALFVYQHGAPHALVSGEPVPLTSRCYSWLRRLMWEEEGRAVNGEYLKTAAGTLAAQAEFSDEVRELHTRAAWVPEENALYYELRPGRAVRVGAGGWEFVPDGAAPVLFRRFPNLKPLPDPERGASLDALHSLLNLKGERDRRLFSAYFCTVVLPHVPRPILNVHGPMGSGKTTAGRVVKRCWDPTAPEAVRYDPRDFLQKASHAFVVMLDNLSALPESASDTICRLVTGEADSKRRLYSDDEDVIVELRRAVILNGINVPTDRGDVLDRSLVVELERIPDGERRTEEELWHLFEEERPRLIGALDVLAEALATRGDSSFQLSRRPRLADWGEWAAAVYEACGWGAEAFLEDWDEVVRAQNVGTLDGSPVAQVIIEFVREHGDYEGTATDLHNKLEGIAEDVARDKAWPKSARWLWRRINEALPLLLAVGIEASCHHTDKGTTIALRETHIDDVSDVSRGESGIDKAKTPDNKHGANVSSNVRNGSNVSSNVSENSAYLSASDNTDNTDNRSGDFSEGPLSNGLKPGESATLGELKARREGRDDDSQLDSPLDDFFRQPPDWYIKQANHCASEGASERLLKPLASSVAYEVFGSAARWQEVLAYIETALKERSRV